MNKSNIYTTNTANFAEGMFIDDLNLTKLSGENFNLANISNNKIIFSLPNKFSNDDILEIQKFDEILENHSLDAYLIFNENILSLQKIVNKFNLNNIEIISDFKLREYAKMSGTFIYELETLKKSVVIINENNKITYFNQLEELEERFPNNIKK